MTSAFRLTFELSANHCKVQSVIFLFFQDDDVECYTDNRGRDYRGYVSVTETGKTCQSWSADEPHDHDYTQEEYSEHSESGLGDHNFCRNPNGETAGPWCYTTDPDTPWELCDVGSPREGCGRKYENNVTLLLLLLFYTFRRDGHVIIASGQSGIRLLPWR